MIKKLLEISRVLSDFFLLRQVRKNIEKKKWRRVNEMNLREKYSNTKAIPKSQKGHAMKYANCAASSLSMWRGGV